MTEFCDYKVTELHFLFFVVLSSKTQITASFSRNGCAKL